MVTRVDKKPIIYNTCFLRVVKPAVVSQNKLVINKVLSIAKGHKIPNISARQIVDDYEDIEYAFRAFGIDDPAYQAFNTGNDEDDDECIRLARVCFDKGKTVKQAMRSERMLDELSRVQYKVFSDAERLYTGTEAVYQAFTRCLWGDVFEKNEIPNYAKWVTDTTKSVLLTQSTYMLIHPSAVKKMTDDMAKDMDYNLWHAWDMFKKMETISIRIGSRKNMFAHAYYAGVNKKGFEPSDNVADDFKMPLTGYCQVKSNVEMHLILGIRYLKIGNIICAMTHDDCINLATMAQCYFRTALYFSKSNGYEGVIMNRAMALVKDIALHCCRLIDAGKNFSHIIRSMHILAQGEFNDSFEREMGTDLGWVERSKNYKKEAHTLDPMGSVYFNRAVSLAIDKTDRLNTCFIYHVFVGDEMHIDDLRTKVSTMTSKVLDADAEEWKNFIAFVKAYTLCRFMLINKTKPKCGGDILQLNEPWATRCVSGMFTMPPKAEWGRVWIEGEFKYTDFADVWHLEAQDVAYVVRDSAGIVSSKYISDRKIHSELLMAMTHGNILDVFTGSTPRSARERICSKGEVKEVVITTAPKAENAKPSWKKRVTFAADCEFRKMQAEYDRNCRRIMSFIRGPSLGVDQCILEKQFADINDATATGLAGSICSHDISGWSESMDRCRKFEFEEVLIKMFDKPTIINIKEDWQKIKAVVSKQGCKDVIKVDNGSFQGFDGSASTILHSMILIYCIDTARRAEIMKSDVKTNMATLIDDCIALMVNLHKTEEANNFWDHLKVTYRKLGFEVDDLKSIFSTIKAIYLSRRFMLGGEVPADYKVFVKAHSSYEDPLRCTLDIPGDIFGAMRGACDANGGAWYIYFCSCLSVLAELAHAHNIIMQIPPSAAAIYALAPVSENGWGFPSVISWATNDITDKRAHFNAILESNAIQACQSAEFQANVDVYPVPAAKAINSLKSQAWRIVSYSNIFTNPFEAIREGPLKPDMLRRNAVQDILSEVAVAEPWASLLRWNMSDTTTRVRELLVQSGPLHAPTLSALVNCMPDNYRLSLVGKAVGSESLLGLLQHHKLNVLKRRMHKCSDAYFTYTKALYSSSNELYDHEDVASICYVDRTKMERDEFYCANGVVMTDHTFPDPVSTFTASSKHTGSMISPNQSSLRVWDKTAPNAPILRVSQLISDKGMYVPRRSGRVWEVTCEYARGWDSVSQRIAMGLAVLARAESDGHKTEGLLIYFIKAWNELSNITPKDTHLIAIHGSIKRLDSNPGSATHPIIVNRNLLRGFNNKLKSALDIIPIECNRVNNTTAHLHDFLAHETAMLCVTALMFSLFHSLGVEDHSRQYNMSVKPACIVAESTLRMSTNTVSNMIQIEIMDGADNYGLLQSCPELVREIAIPTMKSSWVRMINALMDRNPAAVEALRKEAYSTPMPELIGKLMQDEVYYSPSVIIAAEPASRSSYTVSDTARLTISETHEPARAVGDDYTTSVRTVGSRFSRTLSASQPDHIVAATVVRSLVWSRLKEINPIELAKILYMDPDADYSKIKRCSTSDFWRGAIAEISKVSRKNALSTMTMSAFRSLGVPGLHLNHSDDVKEITHAVASYFGAHLKGVIVIIADLVTSLAGRSSRDYAKPFSERIVTNNPTVLNAKLRKEHITKLIASNVEMFKDRIEKLTSGTSTHRGDKRIGEDMRYNRVVELRCRMYVYTSVKINDAGQATIDEAAFARCVYSAAKRVFFRLQIPESELTYEPKNFEDTLNFMYDVKDIIIAKGCEGNDGWHPDDGALGARLAYETVSIDSQMVMSTKFAVSASEVAPRLHRKVIITPAGEPRIPVPQVPSVPASSGLFGPDEGDDDDFMDFMTTEWTFSGISSLKIPYWHALFTLGMVGRYSADKINAALGTSIPEVMGPVNLREAHLEDFDDDTINKAFPNITPDYLHGGVIFDPDWLERDETDAYTTDEIGLTNLGFLF